MELRSFMNSCKALWCLQLGKEKAICSRYRVPSVFKSVDGIVLFVRSIEHVKSSRTPICRGENHKVEECEGTALRRLLHFTENEEQLFKSQSNYRLCIVHAMLEKYCLITFSEYEQLIQNKLVSDQLQVYSVSRLIYTTCKSFWYIDSP